MSRQRSPAPPHLPPKDSSSSLSSSHSANRPTSRHINIDLAEAVRDSVQIGGKSAQASPNLDFSSTSGFRQSPNLPQQPSLNPLVPRRTPSPNPPQNQDSALRADNHNLTANRMSYLQPELPSQRVISSQNPFESDEIEPPPGPIRQPVRSASGDALNGGRGKLTRAQTSTITSSSSSANLLQTSSVAKTRPRRSMSNGSYGLDANGKELTAGQKKALEDKKGGKHVDVIDTWDPTGLGSAMWHHSGPYDAAAPSRNQNLPNTKAPMRAFNLQKGQPAVPAEQEAAQSPPRGPSAIPLASPPVPPAKDTNEGPTRRAQAALDRKPTTRRTSGGLTGHYSTSMPSSGGYFPEMKESSDEAEVARRDRQRQREEKRRALKAAWGIDTPEPFEDFGSSPGEGGHIDLAEEMYSPETGIMPLPSGGAWPARSPGVRMPGVTPPILEDVVSPNSETGAAPVSRPGPAPGGVKRTKSLMQKIKTMRDSHNRSPLRSSSPRTDGGTPTEEAPASTPPSDIPGNPVVRKGFFSRPGRASSPQKYSFNLSADPMAEEEDIVPNGHDFAFVESPDSKARATRALHSEQREKREQRERGSGSEGAGMNGTTGSASQSGKGETVETLADTNGSGQSVNLLDGLDNNRGSNGRGSGGRVRNLPTPPVGPVLPDFGDLMPVRAEDGGVKRKASVVKKLRERIK